MNTDDLDVSILVGKTLESVEVNEQQDTITFKTTDGETYLMYHEQECCELVGIEDICGDVNDLVGSPILIAREDTNSDVNCKSEYAQDSFTWTFYNLATVKGHVTIRWYGTSNGYYSESVDFIEVKEGQNR